MKTHGLYLYHVMFEIYDSLQYSHGLSLDPQNYFKLLTHALVPKLQATWKVTDTIGRRAQIPF